MHGRRIGQLRPLHQPRLQLLGARPGERAKVAVGLDVTLYGPAKPHAADGDFGIQQRRLAGGFTHVAGPLQGEDMPDARHLAGRQRLRQGHALPLALRHAGDRQGGVIAPGQCRVDALGRGARGGGPGQNGRSGEQRPSGRKGGNRSIDTSHAVAPTRERAALQHFEIKKV